MNYRVERGGSGGYVVYRNLKRLGFRLTLWGAKNLIKKDKSGKGPGTIAYQEKYGD